MAGLLDAFKKANKGFNGLLGSFVQPNTLSGLLSQQEAEEAAQQGRLALTSGLLQAGGPSLAPRSFGQNLGGALQGAQQTQVQAGNMALERQMAPYQQALMGAQINRLMNPGISGPPAAQQYFDALTQGMTPEDIEQARRIELGLAPRAGQARVAEVGGIPTVVSADGLRPLSTLEGEANAAATLSQAEAAGKASGSQAGLQLTPGQKAVDDAFATEYVNWQAAGGFADVQKNLDQIREVRAKLRGGDNLSGAIIGNTPRGVLAVANPDALQALEQVEEVVQRNLRLILGAQFTEKEGERLIARAYNPKLSEEYNATRLDKLLRQLEDAAKAKQDAADYFSRNGTLTGWSGKLYSLSDFNPDENAGGATGGWEIVR